jgi:murein DD-endopeptidase MepM/ murein hydrolase activator NlpD
MIELNDFQIQYIEAKLAEVQLRDQDLAEEILDHLCCVVEEQMAAGQPFSRSVTIAFTAFQKDEMQEIQAQIFSIHSKKRLLMRVSLLVLALLMVFSGFLWNRKGGEPPLAIPTAVNFNFEPPSISPLGSAFSVTSSFGPRTHPLLKKKMKHNGIDLKAPEGTPILATASGRVETATYEKRYGYHIILRHDSIYQTMYAHLSEILVEEGQIVDLGDTIGKVGSSGQSVGPHLHYEVIKDGKYDDPEKYLARR